MKRFAIALVLLAGLPVAAAAQENLSSAVRGRVIDRAGEPLAGVRVTAHASSLPGQRVALSSALGDYALSGLPPGAYVLTFEASGYVPFRRTLPIDAGQHVVVDVTLAPAREGYDAIMVAIDDRSIERRPGTHTRAQADLDVLPLVSAVTGALRLSAGPQAVRPGAAQFDLGTGRLRYAGPDMLSPVRDAFAQVTVSALGDATGTGPGRAGSVLAVSRPGGDLWRASARASFGGGGLAADDVSGGTDVDGMAGAGEYTLGGPLVAGRSWFALSAAHAGQTVVERSAIGTTPVEVSDDRAFLLADVTYAIADNHRLSAGLRRLGRESVPASARWLGGASVAPVEDAVWTGAVRLVSTPTDTLNLDARYSDERWTRAHGIAGADDVVARTPVVDQASGAGWWASDCPGCADDESRERSWRLTAARLLGVANGGHFVSLGYEGRTERRSPGTLPAGGLYRLHASDLRIVDGAALPVLRSGSTWISWQPDAGPDVRVTRQAFFAANRWDVGPGLTVDAGLRWDRFDIDRADAGAWTESALSPRLQVAWSPGEYSRWLVSGGVARYAEASVFAAGLPGAARVVVPYGNGAVNAAGPFVPVPAAVATALAEFADRGGQLGAAFLLSPDVDGADAAPARTTTWTIGASRELAMASFVRVDAFSIGETRPRLVAGPNQSLATALGAADALRLSDNSDASSRHVGLATTLQYRIGVQAQAGATYTISRLSGDAPRTLPLGGLPPDVAAAYAEFADPSWSGSTGRHPDDVRQLLTMWGRVDPFVDEKRGVWSITLMQSLVLGQPFGAVGLVDSRPYSVDPGYATPPPAVPYAFTAPDAFRSEALWRTDLGVNWWKRFPGTVYGRLFVQLHVLNLFGDTRPADPAAAAVVRTAFTDPDRFETFDPHRTTPVRGVHWDIDERWRDGLARATTTMPRTFRLSFGVRF